MDEQGINVVFEDRLNPSLYDDRVYVKECHYTKVATPGPLIESSATYSSDSTSSSTDTSSASSPFHHSPSSDKSTLKTASLTRVDVTSFPRL
ncbi:hypothetical protein LIER_02038 [Lithospermum erythrorhizon]|uniref:Uncharacterized protein n=1 Tax=Lithospermum erythrorhizon TaxID=34254 RepID=A0AAV3NP93_LITER